MSEDLDIRTKADADSIWEDIEEVFNGWYAEAPRIDWEDFLDRLEKRGYDLGDSMLSPAIERIKKIVKELRSS